ncbi:electron transport complex protein RnfC [Halopseudomonas bauzanensis]|uniref:Ion-translocating oxidoreductase complex subunit C n=1 Tax=Halopseudomonas bauzanensis TaxID=653930 RepID=A0A1H9R2L0_9GAMM|nr:electron transport complex protein RnfC [Halopseudomonas bauzanensis]SFL61754.1 electron transport complex protein RnfC [Halopseudomonas bauzanensis]
MTAQPRIWDIPGGIHPPQNKHQSTARGLEQMPLPARLVLPLLQHIGNRAVPVVQIGERVLKGQLIAEANGPLSCPVHAPTSGIVRAIEPAPYPHASGLAELAIILESDGQDEWTELRPLLDYRDEQPLNLLDRIRAAGISGLGGAGFPTAVKLASRPDHHIDTLIINGTECEPYITADDMTMRHRAPQIVAGIEVLMHILKPDQVLIGIEDNKPEAIAAMREAVGERPMQVVVIPTKYPSGGEKQLIQILTGKEVPSGGLPADIGILCQNVGTALAVHDAVLLGRPLISRITTLTGAALERPTNVEALIGTPIADLLAFAGLRQNRLYRLVMGGPMMGFTLLDSSAPIIKTSNCLLAGTIEELPPPPPALPCIRCGLCAEACPAELLPQQLHWFAIGKDYEQLQRQNLFDCIECGACAYVCPSSIPLVQYFRAGKAEIRGIELQQSRAEHSRQRFEQRQERLEREAEQRELERQARAEKAARAKAAREAQAAQQQTEQSEQATEPKPAEPDLARIQSRKVTTLSAEQKQLKIAAATARMALQRAQKQLAANPDNADLQAQIPTLEQAFTQAQQAFDAQMSDQEKQ